MISIDPSEIAQWGTTQSARDQLPVLVRKLIWATTPMVSHLDMPYGGSGQQPGWDGIVDVQQGNAWVPAGKSAWEISTERRPARKATADYKKRSDNPLSIDPFRSTFVFATPRQWIGKLNWTKARRDEKRWRDVRTLDATDLAHWLEEAPAVAGWFASLIEKLPASGYIPLTEWWERWSQAPNPPITPDLVMAGRTTTTSALATWLQGSPSPYSLIGHTKDDAIAFLAASAVYAGSEWGDGLMAKALVVDNTSAWRGLESHRQPLVLIRNFDDYSEHHIAVSHGHHVLIPLYESQNPIGSEAATYGYATTSSYRVQQDSDPEHKVSTLPKPRREETVQALTNMGMSPANARRLCDQTARRLSVIRRQLIEDAGGPKPEWASSTSHPWLPGLLLIGQWDEANHNDLELISKVIDRRYKEIASDIATLVLTSDSPLTRVGSLVKFTCHEEAWYLLAPRLTSFQVEDFTEAAVEALRQISPKFDMPIGERYLADVRGKTLPHSDILRQGIARSLVLTAVQSARFRNATNAAYLPQQVIATALNGAEWQVWATLDPLLPILAEADPEAFLSSVEAGLETDTSPLAALLDQRAGTFPFTGILYSGLLRAFEALQWSPDHFTSVAHFFARLAAHASQDMGWNHPLDRLAALFHPYIRTTETTDEHRIATLESLMVRHPQPAWDLLKQRLPAPHDSNISEPHIPFWRPWGTAGVQYATCDDASTFISNLERLFCEHASRRAERWIDVLLILPSLSDDARQLVTKTLSEQVQELRNHPIADELWDKLRRFLYVHRSYPNADCDLSPEQLQLLEDAYRALMPTDPVTAHAWLFSGLPTFPEGAPGGTHDEAKHREIAALRQNAVRQVIDTSGPQAVVSLAEAADVPSLIGHPLVAIYDTVAALDLALKHAGSTSTKIRCLIRGIIAATYEKCGWSKIADTARLIKDDGGDAKDLANLYLAMIGDQPVWDLLAGEPTSVQAAYWQDVHVHLIDPGTPEQVTYVIRNLIEANRSDDAAAVAVKYETPAPTIVEVLAALPYDWGRIDISGDKAGMLPYLISQLLATLDQSSNVDDSQIAELEIPLLHALGRYRPDLTMYRQLCRQPEFFARLFTPAFRAADEQAEQDNDDSVTKQAAWYAIRYILRNFHGCPGQGPDGTIDNESLFVWVSEAQRLCKERGQEDIGNQRIGELLANAPKGDDGIWPFEPMRDLLEHLTSPHIERGIIIGTENNRGVIMRPMHDGGSQERTLADKYRSDADLIQLRWPRTARILRRIASRFDMQAGFYDSQSAKIDEFER